MIATTVLEWLLTVPAALLFIAALVLPLYGAYRLRKWLVGRRPGPKHHPKPMHERRPASTYDMPDQKQALEAVQWNRDDVSGLTLWETVLGYGHKAWWQVPYQVQTLVIGPARSGKTRGVFNPNVLLWPGSVVSTSTRTDVFWATRGRRTHKGTVWLLDPLRAIRRDRLSPAIKILDWSPLRGCEDYDTAQQRAQALSAAIGKGVSDSGHWRERGTQALGFLLLAAAVEKRPMSQVVSWVQEHSLTAPAAVLKRGGYTQAQGALQSIKNAPDKERASIFSAIAGALRPFDAQSVIESADRADECPFDAEEFLSGSNTLYIVAPTDGTVQLAPLVVGVVDEIHHAARRLSDENGGTLSVPTLFALDEVANICPLPSLLGLMSEGGGRGETVIAGAQDLSQIAMRWDHDFAKALFNLAGAKLFLPGVTDVALLKDLEYLGGHTEVQQVSHSQTKHPKERLLAGSKTSFQESYSQKEVPIFAGHRLRQLEAGTAFAIVQHQEPEVIRLIEYTREEPFKSWATWKEAVPLAQPVGLAADPGEALGEAMEPGPEAFPEQPAAMTGTEQPRQGQMNWYGGPNGPEPMEPDPLPDIRRAYDRRAEEEERSEQRRRRITRPVTDDTGEEAVPDE